MLTRTRENLVPGEVIVKSLSQVAGPSASRITGYPGAISDTNGGTYNSVYGKILDVQQGYKNYFNPCTHYKSTDWALKDPVRTVIMYRPTTGSEQLVVDQTSNLFSTNHYSSHVFTASDIAAVPLYSNLSQMSSWTVPDFSAEAMVAMMPQIKEEMSLVNSILELKDFKTLPKLWRRTKSLIERFDLYNLAKNSTYRRKTLRQLTGLGAENYLNWSFAVRPLVSDIVAFARSLKRYKRQVSEILSREGKPQCRHWRKSVSPSVFGITKAASSLPDTYIGWTNYAAWSSYKKIVTFRETEGLPEYCATALYSYRLTDYERRHAYALGLIDALGAKITFSTIWNAIPWSFVVDWFLKVGSWLQQFDPKALQPRIVLHRFVHSVYLETRAQLWGCPWIWLHPKYNAAVSNTPTCYIKSGNVRMYKETFRSYYVRRVCTPNMFTALQTSGLSFPELVLATALAVPKR